VAELLKPVDLRAGHALVLGSGSGRLIEELARQSELHIVVLEQDDEAADRLRGRLDAAGCTARGSP
jgi:16S rRNA A1518/A1519 N6-dimethyltransferase RsmA/KsgA/DIM1 with predicted DNA glycosylase/AP lyase activity